VDVLCCLERVFEAHEHRQKVLDMLSMRQSGCPPVNGVSRFGEPWAFRSPIRTAKTRQGSLGNAFTLALSTTCISPQARH
jgi:hypothetical protein